MLWTCAETLDRLANTCLFMAAGFLRLEDLKTASHLYWCRYGTSVDDVDIGLQGWERRLYESLIRSSDRVLLVGCGAGRDLLALRGLGYDVTGLEPTPELVQRAREHLARRGLTADVRQGFVETTEIDGTYDVVVLAGCCYCYVPRSSARVSTLARIKKHLSEEGRVAVTYAGIQTQSRWLMRTTGTVNWLTHADWRAEPGDHFSRGYFVRRLLTYEHLFSAGEVARECTEAGLRVVREDATTPLPYVIAARS